MMFVAAVFVSATMFVAAVLVPVRWFAMRRVNRAL
jgi:hypothetical protein